MYIYIYTVNGIIFIDTPLYLGKLELPHCDLTVDSVDYGLVGVTKFKISKLYFPLAILHSCYS